LLHQLPEEFELQTAEEVVDRLWNEARKEEVHTQGTKYLWRDFRVGKLITCG
jgi:hypothetical protein